MNYPTPFVNYSIMLKLRLTSLRKSILYILWSTEKTLKAYEILDKLLEIKPNAKPPTVYRVLDYFLNCGVVHKIESIQSYILCREPEINHVSELLLVCSNCQQVKELFDKTLHDLIDKISQTNAFHLDQKAIELKGICNQCG